jgi:hypothetical protein
MVSESLVFESFPDFLAFCRSDPQRAAHVTVTVVSQNKFVVQVHTDPYLAESNTEPRKP